MPIVVIVLLVVVIIVMLVFVLTWESEDFDQMNDRY